MPRYYTKSPEGVAEYKKIGLPYDYTIMDTEYEQWLANTATKGLPKEEKEKSYTRLSRVKTENGEFLTHDLLHKRVDKSLNLQSRYLPEIGKYPIPVPLYETRIVDFGEKERKLKEISNIKSGYSIPFTKQNVEKLYKEGLCHEKTQLILENGDSGAGRKISIKNYSDFRDGDFNELYQFGRILTKEERERIDRDRAAGAKPGIV